MRGCGTGWGRGGQGGGMGRGGIGPGHQEGSSTMIKPAADTGVVAQQSAKTVINNIQRFIQV